MFSAPLWSLPSSRLKKPAYNMWSNTISHPHFVRVSGRFAIFPLRHTSKTVHHRPFVIQPVEHSPFRGTIRQDISPSLLYGLQSCCHTLACWTDATAQSCCHTLACWIDATVKSLRYSSAVKLLLRPSLLLHSRSTGRWGPRLSPHWRGGGDGEVPFDVYESHC